MGLKQIFPVLISITLSIAPIAGLGFNLEGASVDSASGPKGSLEVRILTDEGEYLPGASLSVRPSPHDCSSAFIVADNDANDLSERQHGVIRLPIECGERYYTVLQTTTLDGYVADTMPHDIYVNDTNSSVSVTITNPANVENGTAGGAGCQENCRIITILAIAKDEAGNGKESPAKSLIRVPPSADLMVRNQSPGVNKLSVVVNGRKLEDSLLKDGEEKSINIKSMLTKEANIIDLMAAGKMNSVVVVTVNW